MKQHIKHLLEQAIANLQNEGVLPEAITEIQIENARDRQHGDFACNFALLNAKAVKMNPRSLAEHLVAQLPNSELLDKVSIAGPGFINFTLSQHAHVQIIPKILEQGDAYGKSDMGKDQSIHLEFVSANPTGPLHVGHGRGAAYGSALASLLTAAGHKVHREYYVNDAGRQMDILATSTWLRYLECHDVTHPFPVNGYRGEYIKTIAQDLIHKHGDAFVHPSDTVYSDLPADETEGGDKEIYIDALIARAKETLGADYSVIADFTIDAILTDIKDDLSEFGVVYDEWFSEKSLVTSGSLEEGINKLKANGYTYEKEGALWFKATEFGDEKDRVLIRANGIPTYFASDVAYHVNKANRGSDLLINILGADHHGYVPRLKALFQASGLPPEQLHVILVQFATLYRGQEKVQMSTRSGSFVTLRELREEVGKDAARFFYIMRKENQHMDFDLELAKSQSNENPVYYIQYAHARIASVFRQAADKNIPFDAQQAQSMLGKLSAAHEIDLCKSLAQYPELIESAAKQYEPHKVAQYLKDLAHNFHSYYNAHQFILDDVEQTNARLYLIKATQQVLINGLTLLGISAPQRM